MRTKKNSSFVGVVARKQRALRVFWACLCVLAMVVGAVSWYVASHAVHGTDVAKTFALVGAACGLTLFVAAMAVMSITGDMQATELKAALANVVPRVQTPTEMSNAVAYQEGVAAGIMMSWD
jgi:hypothetical protein